MPNTDCFQKNPDRFTSVEEGRSAERINTNSRYKFFKQTHFTAGDYEQFLEHWDTSSHSRSIPLKTPMAPIDIYRDLSCEDVIHTFEYIFHKYKKGIFFKIVENELRVFLPFSKIEYTNEWSDKIRVDLQKYKNVYHLFEVASARSGFAFDPNRIHYMKDHWYANNGLLRYEFPISENDSGVCALRDMLMTLCRERQVPDGEYFLNKRDFPILKKDRTEAYECIYGNKMPLQSHCYEKYCPILSMTTTDEHADIAIPTWDDWGRAVYEESHHVFGKDFLQYPDPYRSDYQSKKDTAVFRGASTGLGTSIRNNPRLYFTFLSQQQRCDEDGSLFLDCAITKWNCRPRRSVSSEYYDTIDKEVVETLGVGNFLSLKEQAEYKFILHLPGHSEAYRLSMELAMGSVILMYPCRYQLWYSSQLQEYVHYVPLDPSKPLDIFDKIRWCKQHVSECETIASNARQFYEQHLCKDAMLDYLQEKLAQLQNMTGKITFPKKNMFEFQFAIEKDALDIEKKIIQNQRLFPFENVLSYVEMDLSQLHPRSFQVFLFKLDPQYILDEIAKSPIWRQSKNVTMKKITIAHRTLCVKTPLRLVEKDLHHECFVGQIGMNKLANLCPMVLFQYGRWGDSIITDFVEGETFEQFIYQQKSEDVCKHLKLILSQLSILLHFLQAEIGFIHYDLYPWNIIIHKNVKQTQFSFPVAGKTIDFQPAYYPVLIDFGKSHMVYKNIHVANISPFHLHLHQDILSILVSSIFLVVQNHKIPTKEVAEIIHLINYIGQTRYTHYKKFDNLTQIKHFLKIKKKYSNMLLDDKREFKDMDPIRLFDYIGYHGFHRHSQISGLVLSLEIYYSRFMILYELSNIFSTYDESHLYELFQKERHVQKNPVNAFYQTYLEYHWMSVMFPSRLDHQMYFDKMIQYAKKDWKIKEMVAHDSAELPRFFSHPHVMKGTQRSVSHYYERHKVFAIIDHAFSHFSQLSFMRDKKLLFQHYLSPILVANKNSSIANHLALYQEFLHSS